MVSLSLSQLAEQLYLTMSRKFSSELKVWSQYGLYLMKRGKFHQARAVMQRSLKCLTKTEREHSTPSLSPSHCNCLLGISSYAVDVNVISKFAQFEFKHGEPERGRTMFEHILSSYPKRVDIWSVYIDMVLKTDTDTNQIRLPTPLSLHKTSG